MSTTVANAPSASGGLLTSAQPYGDLLVTLTSAYDLRYWDKGSGASMDGAFWHPKPQGTLRPLGTVVVAGYGDLNGQRASMLVGDGGNGAVAAPLDYTWVWDDAGSGADMDGSVWRPVAPAGYVALGDVVTSNHDKPSVNDIWCVRADLVATGSYAGSATWTDQHSGGDHDIAAWQVLLKDPAIDATKAVFEPDTFIGVDNYSTPPNSGLARVLLVPVVAQVFPDPAAPPPLTSHSAPPPVTPAVMDRSVTLPFTCMFDRTDRPSLDNIAEPFCTLQRWANWTLTLFDDNGTTLPQTQSKATTVGITDTSTESFSHSTGIKIGAEFGVVTKWKVELNYQFTYTSSSSRALLTSQTVTRNLTTPAQHAAALWSGHFTFRAVRHDGSSIGQDLPFDVDVFAHTQFPAATDAGSVALAD